MILRSHQEYGVELIEESLRAGLKKPVLAAPCAYGKTVVAAHILSRLAKKGNRARFFCDRINLIDQTLAALDKSGVDVGVMNRDHERYDIWAPIQIQSVQSLVKMKNVSAFDMGIVDECHIMYKSIIELIKTRDIPFVGMSATPYAKGMGDVYNNLLVPITPRQLLDLDYLTPVIYYGGRSVDKTGIKTKQLRTGGNTWNEEQLGDASIKDVYLFGCIVESWILRAENRQTIAFCPSIKHSKWMVDKFNKFGIPAYHIDGYMDSDERRSIYKAHNRGEFYILCCAHLLNTGYDEPRVSCLIDCYPIKSLIQFIQRAGRIMRKYEGKENSVYLDHAGNIEYHGVFPEDVVPTSLDNKEKKFDEVNQVKKEKAEDGGDSLVTECPKCYAKMSGPRCVCGYERKITRRMIETEDDLKELTAPQKRDRRTPNEEKRIILGEFVFHGKEKKYSPGWAKNQYKEMFGSWPNIQPIHTSTLGIVTKKWLAHKAIAWKSRRK